MTANDLLKAAAIKSLNVPQYELEAFNLEWADVLNSEEDDGVFLRASLDVIDKLLKALPDPDKLRSLADFFDKYDEITEHKPEPGHTEVQDDLRNWANLGEEAVKL